MTGSRARIRARRRAGSLIAATALAIAFSAGPQPAPALGVAGSIGPYFPAAVVCETFNDRLIVTGFAGAAPEFNTQPIYYQIYLYDGVELRSPIPPAEGIFVHTRTVTTWNFYLQQYETSTQPWIAAPVTYISPGAGRYAVVIMYWWWDGVVWTGPIAAWSQWIHYAYSIEPLATIWCDLNAE